MSQRDSINIASNTQKIQALFGLVEGLISEIEELKAEMKKPKKAKEQNVHMGA